MQRKISARVRTVFALLCLVHLISKPADAAPSAHDEPIRIGVNVEQSGGGSVLGEAHVNALTLRAAQINEAGGILGHQIELVIRDNQSDPTQALTQTKQLIEAGVVAVIGPGTSPATLAAMPSMLESGLPVISMGSADEIIAPVTERPNVFKTTASGTFMAEGMLADMQAEGIERVALIAVNNAYGVDGVQAWQALADAGRVQLVAIERFEADDIDMTAQLSNLMAADPQAIVVWSIAPGAPTVRRNAVENLGITVPMYFDAGAGVDAFLELAGESANGARIFHPKSLVWQQIPESDPQYAALQAFGSVYSEAHGSASGFAGYSWDALGLLQQAMERAGTTEAGAVVQALEDLEPYVGATGIIDYTADDHQGLDPASLIVVEVQDGQFVPKGG